MVSIVKEEKQKGPVDLLCHDSDLCGWQHPRLLLALSVAMDGGAPELSLPQFPVLGVRFDDGTGLPRRHTEVHSSGGRRRGGVSKASDVGHVTFIHYPRRGRFASRGLREGLLVHFSILVSVIRQ